MLFFFELEHVALSKLKKDASSNSFIEAKREKHSDDCANSCKEIAKVTSKERDNVRNKERSLSIH